EGFAGRRRDSRKAGRLRGIGVANYIEAPVGAPVERVVLTVLPAGEVEMICGTQSTGQGHETVFPQVVADLLDVPLESVRLVTGDSRIVEKGGGTHSARSMRLVGTLLTETCSAIVQQARARAAEALGVAESDVSLTDGMFTAANTNQSFTLF